MVEASTLERRSYRSIAPEYTDLIISDRYQFWTLLISEHQTYPGTMMIWLAREGTMQRKSQCTDEELIELAKVERDAEHALDLLLKPEHINYEWLGNLFDQHGGHGHEHLIPRYKHPIRYRGHNYFDKRWAAHPYVPRDDKYLPPREELLALRDDIKARLPR